MDTNALAVCKAFLDKCPPDMQNDLIQLLPRSDQESLQAIKPSAPFQREHLQWDLLEHTHFSWVSPFLRTLSENDIRLFLAALTEEQSRGLQETLGFRDHLPPLSRASKQALRKLLYESLTQNQKLLPLAFLPESPFNSLVHASSKTLHDLVRHLGLHDLSFEMRQIISTAIMKKIFNALSKKEGDYLNTLLLHREPLVFARLFIQKWDGSKEHMRKLLEERGLCRLGHVLYDAHPSLIWYITHRMDMHKGMLLLKYKEKPTQPREEKILTDQIEKIVKFLTREES